MDIDISTGWWVNGAPYLWKDTAYDNSSKKKRVYISFNRSTSLIFSKIDLRLRDCDQESLKTYFLLTENEKSRLSEKNWKVRLNGQDVFEFDDDNDERTYRKTYEIVKGHFLPKKMVTETIFSPTAGLDFDPLFLLNSNTQQEKFITVYQNDFGIVNIIQGYMERIKNKYLFLLKNYREKHKEDVITGFILVAIFQPLLKMCAEMANSLLHLLRKRIVFHLAYVILFVLKTAILVLDALAIYREGGSFVSHIKQLIKTLPSIKEIFSGVVPFILNVCSDISFFMMAYTFFTFTPPTISDVATYVPLIGNHKYVFPDINAYIKMMQKVAADTTSLFTKTKETVSTLVRDTKAVFLYPFYFIKKNSFSILRNILKGIRNKLGISSGNIRFNSYEERLDAMEKNSEIPLLEAAKNLQEASRTIKSRFELCRYILTFPDILSQITTYVSYFSAGGYILQQFGLFTSLFTSLLTISTPATIAVIGLPMLLFLARALLHLFGTIFNFMSYYAAKDILEADTSLSDIEKKLKAQKCWEEGTQGISNLHIPAPIIQQIITTPGIKDTEYATYFTEAADLQNAISQDMMLEYILFKTKRHIIDPTVFGIQYTIEYYKNNSFDSMELSDRIYFVQKECEILSQTKKEKEEKIKKYEADIKDYQKKLSIFAQNQTQIGDDISNAIAEIGRLGSEIKTLSTEVEKISSILSEKRRELDMLKTVEADRYLNPSADINEILITTRDSKRKILLQKDAYYETYTKTKNGNDMTEAMVYEYLVKKYDENYKAKETDVILSAEELSFCVDYEKNVLELLEKSKTILPMEVFLEKPRKDLFEELKSLEMQKEDLNRISTESRLHYFTSIFSKKYNFLLEQKKIFEKKVSSSNIKDFKQEAIRVVDEQIKILKEVDNYAKSFEQLRVSQIDDIFARIQKLEEGYFADTEKYIGEGKIIPETTLDIVKEIDVEYKKLEEIQKNDPDNPYLARFIDKMKGNRSFFEAKNKITKEIYKTIEKNTEDEKIRMEIFNTKNALPDIKLEKLRDTYSLNLKEYNSDLHLFDFLKEKYKLVPRDKIPEAELHFLQNYEYTFIRNIQEIKETVYGNSIALQQLYLKQEPSELGKEKYKSFLTKMKDVIDNVILERDKTPAEQFVRDEIIYETTNQRKELSAVATIVKNSIENEIQTVGQSNIFLFAYSNQALKDMQKIRWVYEENKKKIIEDYLKKNDQADKDPKKSQKEIDDYKNELLEQCERLLRIEKNIFLNRQDNIQGNDILVQTKDGNYTFLAMDDHYRIDFLKKYNGTQYSEHTNVDNSGLYSYLYQKYFDKSQTESYKINVHTKEEIDFGIAYELDVLDAIIKMKNAVSETDLSPSLYYKKIGTDVLERNTDEKLIECTKYSNYLNSDIVKKFPFLKKAIERGDTSILEKIPKEYQKDPSVVFNDLDKKFAIYFAEQMKILGDRMIEENKIIEEERRQKQKKHDTIDFIKKREKEAFLNAEKTTQYVDLLTEIHHKIYKSFEYDTSLNIENFIDSNPSIISEINDYTETFADVLKDVNMYIHENPAQLFYYYKNVIASQPTPMKMDEFIEKIDNCALFLKKYVELFSGIKIDVEKSKNTPYFISELDVSLESTRTIVRQYEDYKPILQNILENVKKITSTSLNAIEETIFRNCETTSLSLLIKSRENDKQKIKENYYYLNDPQSQKEKDEMIHAIDKDIERLKSLEKNAKSSSWNSRKEEVIKEYNDFVHKRATEIEIAKKDFYSPENVKKYSDYYGTFTYLLKSIANNSVKRERPDEFTTTINLYLENAVKAIENVRNVIHSNPLFLYDYFAQMYPSEKNSNAGYLSFIKNIELYESAVSRVLKDYEKVKDVIPYSKERLQELLFTIRGYTDETYVSEKSFIGDVKKIVEKIDETKYDSLGKYITEHSSDIIDSYINQLNAKKTFFESKKQKEMDNIFLKNSNRQIKNIDKEIQYYKTLQSNISSGKIPNERISYDKIYLHPDVLI